MVRHRVTPERRGISEHNLYNWLKQHKQATNPEPAVRKQYGLSGQ